MKEHEMYDIRGTSWHAVIDLLIATALQPNIIRVRGAMLKRHSASLIMPHVLLHVHLDA
jgi:hypothetical protein